MDNIEIQIHNEINDYKEKIYFFNFRQWLFAILIVAIVIPTYLILKEKIGDEITSYIVIVIAGVLGFVGFVKLHELPAEKILPYWTRHYFFFSKPVKYITDQELEMSQNKKNKKYKNIIKKAVEKNNSTIPKLEKINKTQIRAMKKQAKEQRLLEKAKKKYKYIEKESKIVEKIEGPTNMKDILNERIENLTKEEQQILLELLKK
jgi:hypothetical protein